MIQYALKCADGHEFDSWFQSAMAFDKLVSAGMVTCAVCGGAKVTKAIMTPRVRTARGAVPGVPVMPAGDPQISAPGAGSKTSGPLSQPASPAEQALADLRKKIEENSDYVGKDFATEARAMHDGDAPVRAIYGEARVEEAKQLIDDGVPVAPLPFMPNRKTN
jgi:hypothetical protein